LFTNPANRRVSHRAPDLSGKAASIRRSLWLDLCYVDASCAATHPKGVLITALQSGDPWKVQDPVAYLQHRLRKAMISDLTTEKIQLRRLCAVQEDSMQQGSVIMSERKHGPAVWQFRWSETGAQGQRVYRKRVVGTVEEYPNSEAVREAFKGLIAKPTSAVQYMKPLDMTVGELCPAFPTTGTGTR
jgi:hypothetical protein